MDILDGSGYYEEWFVFKETDPHNENYEFLGISDKNFIMNSGSYFIVASGVIIITIAKYIINYLAVKLAKFKVARRLGMWAYQKTYFKNSVIANLKLFLEAFFDLTLCAFLNMYAFYKSPSMQDL